MGTAITIAALAGLFLVLMLVLFGLLAGWTIARHFERDRKNQK
ncbi:hypothetical protein [Amycolatopsis sp.]|nr:hypothetical protein [Amycolatopsis sp.]HVV12461.1 hypothetical protein [Amycolatopsis sp.]